jgi:hypothetical protein
MKQPNPANRLDSNCDLLAPIRVNHPKARRAYAWSHLDGKNDERTRFVAVLEIPPVNSAETAVRVQIVKDFKTGYAK